MSDDSPAIDVITSGDVVGLCIEGRSTTTMFPDAARKLGLALVAAADAIVPPEAEEAATGFVCINPRHAGEHEVSEFCGRAFVPGDGA